MNSLLAAIGLFVALVYPSICQQLHATRTFKTSARRATWCCSWHTYKFVLESAVYIGIGRLYSCAFTHRSSRFGTAIGLHSIASRRSIALKPSTAKFVSRHYTFLLRFTLSSGHTDHLISNDFTGRFASFRTAREHQVGFILSSVLN